MKTESIIKGQTIKAVSITNVLDMNTEDEILDHALAATNETRTRLFGWSVNRFSDGSAVVDLYTD